MASNCISEQDFAVIREEVFGNPARFERLIRVSEALLKPFINNNVRNSQAARSDLNFAGDIMNDVHLKLMTKIVTHFFLRDSDEEEKDALGLTRWMFTVARNATLTALKKSGSRIPVSLIQDNDDEEEYELPIADGAAERQPGVLMEQRESVSECFRHVIDTSSAGYIILSTLSIYMITLETGSSRIEAERIFVERFSEKPLDEILAYLSENIRKRPWLDISNTQLNRFKEKLDAPIDGRRSGEYPLKDFAMKKGLDNTLSDWLNRMDARLKKHFQDSCTAYAAPDWSMTNTR